MEAILETTEALQQKSEEQVYYLVQMVHVLVGRLGGEVVVSPEELGQAARYTEARWEQTEEGYAVKLGECR